MSKRIVWTCALKQLTTHGQAAVKYLAALQASELKLLARNTGITTGKKKSDTALGLVSSLSALGPHHVYKSVDMGVKNLAVCVVRPNTESATSESSAYYTLQHWDRSDVLTAASAPVEAGEADSESDSKPESTVGAYSPSNLAPHAARIAYLLHSEHKPSHILVERQRFRSMGGAAVQEWTLRVNSLEAMLWASFETLKQEQLRRQSTLEPAQTFFPEVIEVSPARIAAFWNGRGSDWSLQSEGIDRLIGRDSKTAKKQAADAEDRAKRGMEKSEKIALVRNWLQTGAVDVVASLQPLASAFMHTGRARKADGDVVISKKDDLADCVVQGVTWGLVQRNRRTLHDYLSGLADIKSAAD